MNDNNNQNNDNNLNTTNNENKNQVNKRRDNINNNQNINNIPRRYNPLNPGSMSTSNINNSLNKNNKKQNSIINNQASNYGNHLRKNRKKDNDFINNGLNSNLKNRLNRFNKKKQQDEENNIDDNQNNNVDNTSNNIVDNTSNNNQNDSIDNNTNNNTPNNSIEKNNYKNSPMSNQVQKPKTKGSGNVKKDVAKALSKKGKIRKGLALAKVVKDQVDNIEEKAEEVKEQAQEVAQNVKQQAKTAVKRKIIARLIQLILPFIPYIILGLIIIFLILVIIFSIISIVSDEENVIDSIQLNYCEHVNLKWGDGDEENKTISSNEYIAYQLTMNELTQLDDETIKALAVIYRTNLYQSSNNLDSNVCNYDIDEEYTEVDSKLTDLIEKTGNKVFTLTSDHLNHLDIDEKFTYTFIDNNRYVLYQDKMYYDKNWIDNNVDSSLINQGSTIKYSFSPYASWYLSKHGDYNYHGLLYHFYAPSATASYVYNAIRIGGSDGWGDGSDLCSDISLSSTSLEKEEFVNFVNQNVNNSVFKSNAEKIYDISIKNNFNPEMVVIRAVAEGFSPGGSTNNYWGLGCTNTGGRAACSNYSSFDNGILGYINNIKNHNYATVYQMMLKYAYIGRYWYNPGGSGKGGCYYFPHIKEYMSEDRISVVEEACASNNRCNDSQCVSTTDEDQSAYAKWQVSKMTSIRAQLFNITADNCTESEGEGEETGDLNTLGARVANYAVKTYDSWQYSQANRHQDGYVDCSSMVSRAYKHFNVKIYNSSDTTGEIYRWCEQNAKTISGNNLQAGDLIFYNSLSHRNSNNYLGIGHVEMYIGNNQRFGAHTHYKNNPENDVSVKLYFGGGNLFCRPSKR